MSGFIKDSNIMDVDPKHPDYIRGYECGGLYTSYVAALFSEKPSNVFQFAAGYYTKKYES